MSSDIHDMYTSVHLMRNERRNRTDHSSEQPTPDERAGPFPKQPRRYDVLRFA